MNVPEVVQTTSVMIAHMRHAGPGEPVPPGEPERPWSVSAAGGALMSTSPSLSEEQVQDAAGVGEPCGPVDAERGQEPLTAPPLANRNRNTTLIATELVTDGK